MKMRLLMVEDNPGDVRLAREALATCSFPAELIVAPDGRQALSLLRRANGPRPDMILLDLSMPLMSGTEVLQELKGDEALRDIPVVVFSSSNAKEDVQRSYQRGANCYLRKPASLEGLRYAMSSLQSFWFGLAELPQH
jgi:two-component system, chemotaxis family, response regulator Rcp1